ncbi:hypothetical protein RSOLAG1IB_05619 [Rhizoctonia solani AG-1 IB]|uniref:Uncharacterized protein n=1 Tax=Thanatephorus cucumeris (strain AG1-IB / isolate 7/3/14) TaxID=1108050 RepID=A0A0B7G1L1_THACB|nr:hypothetical protein RSOLAG1IB_05619 [Rhizoctonia solani AG-1 IB]
MNSSIRDTSGRSLPVEIIALIVDEAATPTAPGAFIPLDATSLQPLVAAKAKFDAIRGLSSTNHWIRRRVLSRWFTTMIIREEAEAFGATSHREPLVYDKFIMGILCHTVVAPSSFKSFARAPRTLCNNANVANKVNSCVKLSYSVVQGALSTTQDRVLPQDQAN